MDGAVIRSDVCEWQPPSTGTPYPALFHNHADNATPGCPDRIKFGHHCVIGAKSTVQPACVVKPDGSASYAPLAVGSFVHIGSNVSISALAIGSHVVIGDGAVIENQVDVKSCVMVTSGSVVKEAVTLPSHTGESFMLQQQSCSMC
jgi:acetyltransferase-like isoleucine patch superfamily enzyme